MQRLFWALLVTLLVAAIGAVPVEALTNLNGSYAFTTTRSCSVQFNSPFGFDATGAQTVITDGVFRQIATDTGVTTFNPDGTGMNVGQSHTMNISATGGSIFSITTFSNPFTYTVNDDNTVDLSEGVVTFSIILGSGAGLTGTNSARSARAAIGNGANTLVTAGVTDIEQETLPFFNSSGSLVFTQYRLCTRSNTSVRQ